MHHAGAAPQQHVRIGLALDVAAKVLVRRPEHLFPLGGQVLDDGQGDAAGHHPIRQRLHLGRGVGVNHGGASRMGLAEGGEVLRRAADVQGAGRLQGGHEHALVRGEDLGGLPHEADAGDDQGLRPMVPAEAGHLQGVRHKAAGGLRQVLHIPIDVVVGHQHRVPGFEQFRHPLMQPLPLLHRHQSRPMLRNALCGQGVVRKVHAADSPLLSAASLALREGPSKRRASIAGVTG